MEHEASRMGELYQLVLVTGFFAFAILAHLLREVIFIRNGEIDKSEFLFFLIFFCFLFMVFVEVVR